MSHWFEHRATQPSVEIVDVTPDVAADWLEKLNTHNRNMRQSRVDAYARDMTAGRWQFNGDPIRFAADDTLLDGQHRLWAVVVADVTVRFVVVRDLPAASQETMDIGAHRTLGDALTLRGETNGAMLAAVVRRVIRFDHGVRSVGGPLNPTHAEMSNYIETHGQVRRAVEVALRAGSAGLPVAPSVIGAAYEICSRIDRDAAEQFYVTQLIEAIGLQAGDPARTLLRRLQEETGRGRQMHPDDAFRYAFLGWNHFRSGRSITRLQAPKGGWTAANFPQPR